MKEDEDRAAEGHRDPNAGRKFNSMKNRDLADVLLDFYNGKYQQTPSNEAKFEALVKVIIGRLKTLDGAKAAVKPSKGLYKKKFIASNKEAKDGEARREDRIS